jgi:predicted DNA-binding transcriptional regulator AlpA
MKKAKPLTGEQKEFLRDQPNQLLKLDEVLALLHTNRASFYRGHPLVKCRIKMGRSSFWSKQLVLDWIKQQQEEANSRINAA